MYFLDQKRLQAIVVKIYWQIKDQINFKKINIDNLPVYTKILKYWLDLMPVKLHTIQLTAEFW